MIIPGKISDVKVNVNRGQIVTITSSKVSDVTVLERCRCANEVTINADVFRMGAGLVGDKAVNREDKLSRRYRDRDLAKFESSRRYRER